MMDRPAGSQAHCLQTLVIDSFVESTDRPEFLSKPERIMFLPDWKIVAMEIKIMT